MRILVTGGAGQIGTELGRADWGEHVTVLRPTRLELDVCDQTSIRVYLEEQIPDGIINSAAYTAVDAAEDDIEAAWLTNAIAPALLAAASRKAGIPIVHISTDYVFDGTAPGAYRESDPVSPLGVYGASKLAGEIAIMSGNPRSLILRTAWVVSAHRSNFIKAMLRLGASRPDLRVVADQTGSPTSAADIAGALTTIMRTMVSDANAPTGVYHYVNAGEASWYDLAKHTFVRAATLDAEASQPVIHAITTADYPTPAQRPANSRLSTEKLTRDYGVRPRGWESAVDEIIAQLVPSRRYEATSAA